TGSTVREWDTMIYLKDTASPQEYDQAIFRLQNQYVTSALDDKTNEVIKIDLKPQTLLVDFAPNRMFYMQEKKAQIYNANVDKSGNSKLGERIREELRISPIIVLNKDKMDIVKETNILEAISNYNMDKGISEEVKEVSVDLSILDNPIIKARIELENEMNSRGGLETKAGEGSGQNLDVDTQQHDPEDDKKTDVSQTENKDSQVNNYVKKIQNFYRRILLFAFLTKNKVVSLENIIDIINSEENSRIAKNLGLKRSELKELSKSFKNKFALSSLDYKIQDLSILSHNADVSNEERIKMALSKFGKLGESVVITSPKICDEMIGLIEDSFFKEIDCKNRFFVDIASVSGEFAQSLHTRLSSIGLNLNNYKHNILAFPKNNVCYELTRKVYEYIGLDVNCISDIVNSYELIHPTQRISELSKESILKKYFPKLWNSLKKEDKNMIEFGAIVGNPPYHEIVSKSSGNKSLGKELFPSFIKLSTKLTSRYVSLITPSKWFTSDGQDQSFPALREYIKQNNHIKILVNYTDNKEIFPDVSLGSVNYFLYDTEHNSGLMKFYEDGKSTFVERPLFEHGLDIIFSMNSMSSIVNKVLSFGTFESLKAHAKGRNAFGISGKKETVETETSDSPFVDSIEVRCAHEVIRYIAKDKIIKNVNVMNHYKVFTSKGNGASGTLDINNPNYIIGKAYVGKPGSVCTDSLIPIGCFNSEEEAINLQTYMKTKFLRYLVGVMKTSRNIYQVVYEFVPVQNFTSSSDIDWSKSIQEIDKQLYKKYKLDKNELELIENIIKPMV
ncbi:MAG: Eco57I restriction-modification methylase domain-containing protein, partial [Bacilli bacterium]|nr:Eco57I restriction-modification methylase domain-containing protein [Bacilli bacterium]